MTSAQNAQTSCYLINLGTIGSRGGLYDGMKHRMAKAPAGYGRNKRNVITMKLVVAVAMMNVVGVAIAVYAATAIRAIPSDGSVEQAWKFGYYGMMLLVGVTDALLVDQLAFGGAFRLVHVKGFSARFSRDSDDINAVAATFQPSNISFPFSVLLCTVGTYLLFNVTNHDFDAYYRHIGQHFTALRGDAPDKAQQRRDAIDTLSIRYRHEVIPYLVHSMGREGEIGAWSAWALGRHRDDQNPGRMIAPLVEASRTGDPALQREALLALARLQHRPIVERVQQALARELSHGAKVDIRLLWGLAYIQSTSSLKILERALYEGEEDIQRASAWALAQLRDQKGGRDAVGILEARMPSASFQVQCAIIHSLGTLADESSNLAIMHAHDAISSEDRGQVCERMSIFIRPDRKQDRYDALVPQETFQRKCLQSMGGMRATTPAIREQVEPWLEAMIADEETAGLTRESAQSLLSGIRAGRDDNDKRH